MSTIPWRAAALALLTAAPLAQAQPPGVKPRFVECDPARPDLPCTPAPKALDAPIKPLDVTDRMALPPGKVSLDLTQNLILGDPRNAIPTGLDTRLPAIEACLQRLGPQMTTGMGATAVDLKIDATGKQVAATIHGAKPKTQACLDAALKGLTFPAGRARMGVVKLLIPPPALKPIPNTTDALIWTAPGDKMRFMVTVQRVRIADGRWRLAFKGRITADAKRGVARGSLRHNHSYLQRSGRSKNGFSLQTSAGVDRCLEPGQMETLAADGRHSIAKGEMYSAQVYFLAGDCESGTGRYEVGTVQLDGRTSDPPVLRAIPTWSYRLHARHK